MCDLCKEKYGPCSLFENFLLTVKFFKGNVTRSKNATYQDDESNNKLRDSDDDVIYKELQNEVINEFLSQGSACGTAADKKSMDVVLYFKIVREGIAKENMYDKSDHCVIRGRLKIEGW